MNFCYLNGQILPYNKCHLHISDLQIQRGYGVFDFFRCRKGSIPWLEDYTDRFFNSIVHSGMKAPISRDDFYETIFALQQKNQMENGAFKAILTGGNSDNLATVSGNPNLIILNVPWNPPSTESFDKGVSLITYRYSRPDPEIKSLFYFNLLKLQDKIIKYAAIDVLYHEELITETSRANVFFIKNGNISTPAENILKGIIRKQILSLYPETKPEKISHEQIFDFDEIFISSTSRDITPVVNINGRKIGNGKPGKVTREIQAEFKIHEHKALWK